MKFDELCDLLKNKKTLDFFRKKKIVEFDDQPERLSEKTLYNNEEEMRLEEIHFSPE